MANLEPMMEVSHEQARGLNFSDKQLRDISTKIKCTTFGKIPIRGRNRVDPTCDHGEEDSLGRTCGVYDDRQPPSGEAPSVCKTGDQWDDPHQSLLGYDRNNQTLDNSVSREIGVEDRADGSMEVKGHWRLLLLDPFRFTTTLFRIMNILIWNCRGAMKPLLGKQSWIWWSGTHLS